MTRGKRIAYALLSAIFFFTLVLTPMKTEAGLNEHVLDYNMLDSANWSNPEEDVVVEEGKIIFSADSTEYSRYISKQAVKLDTLFDYLVELSANVKFAKLPTDKSFIIAFGLEGIETMTGEAMNVEVSFTNKGGIKVGVNAYDEDGNMHVVAKEAACGMSLNQAAKVGVTITTSGNIQVSVNGRNVCSGKLPVTGEGRVGFLQSGACAVEIANLEIKHYEYSRPENTNIFEDFEKEGMDVSVLTSRAPNMESIYPRGQAIEDYEGNRVLRHRNVADTYVGTLYQYSNFEMTFDVPYINTITEYDDNGKKVKSGQSRIMISMGNEQADWETSGWTSAVETVVFGNGSVYSFNNPTDISAELAKNPYAGEGRAFSVKVSVVDAVVTAGIKWIEEDKFDTVLTYKLKGGTPTGYVQIWIPESGNCAIDNLKITNLDDNPNLIDVEYKSGKWQNPGDYEYTPMERVYAEGEQTEEGTLLANTWYWFLPIIATVAGIVSLIITGKAVRIKRMQKEEATHEE